MFFLDTNKKQSFSHCHRAGPHHDQPAHDSPRSYKDFNTRKENAATTQTAEGFIKCER